MIRLTPEYVGAIRAGSTVVSPTTAVSRMLADAYHAHVHRAGESTWPTPDILPWDAWTRRLFEHRAGDGPSVFVLSREQERALWGAIVAGGDVDHSPRTQRLAALAMDAWSTMHRWRLDPDDLFRRPVPAAAAAFRRWSRDFVAACEGCGAIDRTRAAAALAATGPPSLRPGAAPVMLHGFLEHAPLETAIIDGLTAAGFRFSKAPVASAAAAPVARRFADPESEIRAAARWSLDRMRADPDAGIVVVFTELDQLRGIVRHTFTTTLAPDGNRLAALEAGPDCSLAGDGALLDSPMIRSALALLTLPPRRLDWQDASALLRCSYLGGASTERHARALLDVRLREQGGVATPAARLVAAADRDGVGAGDFAVRIRAVAASRENAPRRQSLNAWVAQFDRILDAAGWPGDAVLSAADEPVIDAWHRALESLASLDTVLGEVDGDRAIRELSAVLTAARIDVAPGAAVRILTPEDAAALQPDYVWIAGVHDAAWPPRRDPNPLLPYRVQRAAGVPGTDPQADMRRARLLLRHLGRASRGCVFSVAVTDNDVPLRPSPLLEAFRPQAVERADPAWAPAGDPRPRLEPFDDRRGPPLTGPGPIRGGVAVFTDQAACPFRGFARHRLRSRAVEDPVPGLGPRQRGELVHRALQDFWTAVPNQTALLELSGTALHARAAAAAGRAIAALRGRFDLGPRYWDLEHERLRDLLLEAAHAERERPPFEVVAAELPLMFCHGGIELTVRVDRVDRLEDGSEVLIDYKTGDARRGDWAGPRPDRPQLPLYALHRPAAAGVAYARIHKGGCGYVDEPAGIVSGAATDGGSEPPFSERLSRWREEMSLIAAEVRSGLAAVQPKRGASTCRDCDLEVLCRVHDIRDRDAPDAAPRETP